MTALETLISLANARNFLKEAGIPTDDETTHATALTLCKRIAGATSQAKYAAFLINATKGNIHPTDITNALREGPHYASLSRTGKLKGCDYSVPKQGRVVVKGPDTAALTAKVAELTAILDAIMECKNIKAVRKTMAAAEYTVSGEE